MATNNLSSSGENFQFHNHIYTEDSRGKTEFMIEDIETGVHHILVAQSLSRDMTRSKDTDFGITRDLLNETIGNSSRFHDSHLKEISLSDNDMMQEVKNEGVGTDELELLMLEDQHNHDIISSGFSNRSAY